MKHREYRWWQMLVLVVLAAATVLSLVIPERFLVGPDPKRVEVSILIRQADNTFCATARQGMEQAAEDLGAELRFLTLPEDNDSDAQIELLRREIDVGVDAAVVAPVDCEKLALFLGNAPPIPVVSIESPVDGTSAGVYPNNEQAGQLLAEQLISDFPDGGQVLLVNSCPGAVGLSTRLECAQKLLQDAGFSIAVCNGFSTQKLLEKADFVVCFEAQALDIAVQQSSECAAPPKIYGAGVTDSVVAQVERGQISVLAAWSEYAVGYLSVTQAVAAARNQSVEDYLLPVSIVQEGNTYDPDHQKLLYPIAG